MSAPFGALGSLNKGYANGIRFNNLIDTNSTSFTADRNCIVIGIAVSQNANSTDGGKQYPNNGFNTNGELLMSKEGTTSGMAGSPIWTWYTGKTNVYIVRMAPGNTVTISGNAFATLIVGY